MRSTPITNPHKFGVTAVGKSIVDAINFDLENGYNGIGRKPFKYWLLEQPIVAERLGGNTLDSLMYLTNNLTSYEILTLIQNYLVVGLDYSLHDIRLTEPLKGEPNYDVEMAKWKLVEAYYLEIRKMATEGARTAEEKLIFRQMSSC